MKSFSLHRSRFVVGLLCIVAITAFPVLTIGQTEDEKIIERRENLKTTVIALREAYEKKDFWAITDLFAKETVEDLGGREMFAEWVEMGRSASEQTVASFADVSEPILLDERWFAVIPFRMDFKLSRFEKRVTRTCLVAVSTDGGSTWQLHTGESIFTTFPDLFGRLEILERVVTVIPIESD